MSLFEFPQFDHYKITHAMPQFKTTAQVAQLGKLLQGAKEVYISGTEEQDISGFKASSKIRFHCLPIATEEIFRQILTSFKDKQYLKFNQCWMFKSATLSLPEPSIGQTIEINEPHLIGSENSNLVTLHTLYTSLEKKFKKSLSR
jgi:hypothetical protein